MNKSELRKIYLGKQKSLTLFERKQKSEQLAENFFENFDLSRIDFAHCFLSIEKFNEIDTKIIFEKFWTDFSHIKTLAPRVNFQTGEIESIKYTSDTELKQNQWQISEPAHGEAVETERMDMVLIPLLCFDLHGFRVGYGKGFYDKFLNNCRADCLKIGLSYFEPIDEITDAQKFDVRLDFCVTPERIVNCQ